MTPAEQAAYDQGYADASRWMEDTWPVLVAPVIAYRPDHAELDRRRYPPDGRLSWIIPRPGEQG